MINVHTLSLMPFHTRRTLPVQPGAFGDRLATTAAKAAAARARNYALAQKREEAAREAEAREHKRKLREARRHRSARLPRDPQAMAQRRLKKWWGKNKRDHVAGLTNRPAWGTGRARNSEDGKRGARWYDSNERREGATGSALAQQRVKEHELKMTRAGPSQHQRSMERMKRVRLATLDLDSRDIIIRSSHEFKKGSYILLKNGAMHRSARQKILRDKLGDGVDVGEVKSAWRPGYRNNIVCSRGTKVASQRILEERAINMAARGAIEESFRAPIGYGGTVRLFSP